MTTQPTEKSLRYRPEIDGLRALAVLPVILFHLKPAWLSGGFLGVDVFFVISGFLITSIILRERETRRFSFRAFWIRRARRILPVLVSVVIATTLAAYFLLPLFSGPEIGFQGISALFSFANFTMCQLEGQYWGSAAANSPYLHIWSLSIEEQFYLLFPVILFLALKFKPRLLLPLLLSLLVGSLALFLYGISHFPDSTFFLLPTRAWELASGAVLAALQGRIVLASRGLRAEWLGIAGIFLIGFSYFFISTLSAKFLLPVIGAILVLAFARQGIACRLLSLAPLVFIGQISYSLYMWHWPIIVFCRNQIPHWMIVSLILTVLVSLASYYLIEKPGRSHPRALPFLAATFVLAFAFTFWLARQPEFYDASRFSPAIWLGWRYDVAPRSDKADPNVAKRFQGVIAPDREPGLENAFKEEGIIKHYGKGNPRIVVLGDSHAVMWCGAIDEICRELGVTVSFDAMTGVPPFIKIPIVEETPGKRLTAKEKYSYDLSRMNLIEKWKPEIVIFVARWESFSMEDVRPFFSFLETQTRHIIVIEQPPKLPIDDINLGQYLCYKDFKPIPGQKQYLLPASPSASKLSRYEKGRSLVREIARAFPKITLVGISKNYLEPDGKILILEGKDLLYLDDDHLSEFGVSKSTPELKEAIVKSLHQP